MRTVVGTKFLLDKPSPIDYSKKKQTASAVNIITPKDEEEEEYAYPFAREDGPQGKQSMPAAGRLSGIRICGR